MHTHPTSRFARAVDRFEETFIAVLLGAAIGSWWFWARRNYGLACLVSGVPLGVLGLLAIVMSTL